MNMLTGAGLNAGESPAMPAPAGSPLGLLLSLTRTAPHGTPVGLLLTLTKP